MGSARWSDERFLAGACAAVTGGGSGIGRAIALHLARVGARVAVGDVDMAAAEAVAAEAGADAFAVALDIADPHQFAAFLDSAEQRHGPLRVMVNNAGVDWVGPFHEEPDEVTRREIDVNLYGTTLGSKLALQRMLPRYGGHLVNIASGGGRVPLPGSATYAATTSGTCMLLDAGNAYAAAALARQFVEIEYLLWTFADDPQDMTGWLHASRSQLGKRFQPATMRERSNGAFRAAEEHRSHCEHGGHPNPSAWFLVSDSPPGRSGSRRMGRSRPPSRACMGTTRSAPAAQWATSPPPITMPTRLSECAAPGTRSDVSQTDPAPQLIDEDRSMVGYPRRPAAQWSARARPARAMGHEQHLRQGPQAAATRVG